MRSRAARPFAITAALLALGAAGGLAGLGGCAGTPANPAGHRAHAAGASQRRDRWLPRQIYAPYFETWAKDRLPLVAARSGARFFTLAFLQTARPGSCTLTWDGSRDQAIARGRYLRQIAMLRTMGGDVIPSFGGFRADHAGTEIADSCASVRRIAQAYESVVLRYGVTRLDMDVEDNSLGDEAGIARRSQALALLQRWAARTHRRIQIVFTLRVEPGGLPGNCLAIVKSALSAGVRLASVNIMAFDYFDNYRPTPSDMGTQALRALAATHRQLASLFPRLSSSGLWAIEGITLLPGIDDFPKKTEVTYLRDAARVRDFARSHGLPMVSIWTVQRDDGRCPRVIDSNSCSGIAQQRWAFSHLLNSYPPRARL
jgi:hypothetical protein